MQDSEPVPTYNQIFHTSLKDKHEDQAVNMCLKHFVFLNYYRSDSIGQVSRGK